MSTEMEMYTGAPLPDRWNYALAMAAAGDMVPKGMRTNNQPDPGKIFFTFETGSMLGIHPVAAIQGVNVIEGKPTLSPALMTAVIRRAGHLVRVTTSGSLEDLSLAAHAELVRQDDPEHPFRVTWTIETARVAGLLLIIDGKVSAKVGRNQEPGVWEKYTAAMLKARALSEVCREGGTDALMGLGYTPEELGANVGENGEIVHVEPLSYVDGPRRPALSADDYRPIALVQEQPATVAATSPEETDQYVVDNYGLADLQTSDDARRAYLAAQHAGDLDRPVEGKPLGQWLQDFATEVDAIAADVDRQTGVVTESQATA